MPALPLNTSLLTDVDALRGIVDVVPHPIFVKDEETRFVVVNDMMCRLMNRSYDELIGRTDQDFVPREQADLFRGNDLRVLNTGEISENEELFSDGDGELRTIVTRKKRLVLSSGARLLVGCITDISDFRHAEALIRHHAEHDALTGLANRRFFNEKVTEAMSRVGRNAAAYSLLLIDLDRFKPVNDAYGHTVGDSVLCEIAVRLKSVTRSGDVVARLGGDEFAILSESSGSEGAQAPRNLAVRVIEAVSAPIQIGDLAVEVGASVGISRSPENGITAESLLHAADLAMYRGKQSGRGAFRFFEEQMDVEMREQTALEADFRRAVAAGDVKPYYQPLVDLSDSRLLGFEILARWQHPTRGYVGPDKFIPIAERLGLISELTFALLRIATTEAREWPGELTLALNISPVQLDDPLLPMQILRVLNETGFPASRLEIEITENAIVGDIASARAILSSFQNLGMRVSLDDFGTGYSSLTHLRELHFDKLKIDRSFVQSMEANPESAKIVNAILGLAKSLGVPTTAEGIEDAAALKFLTDGGAVYGQGYFFGKAMPAAEVTALVKAASVGAPLRQTG